MGKKRIKGCWKRCELGSVKEISKVTSSHKSKYLTASKLS